MKKFSRCLISLVLMAALLLGTAALADNNFYVGMETEVGVLEELRSLDGALYGLTDEGIWAVLYVYANTEDLDIPDTLDSVSVGWICADALEDAEALTAIHLGSDTCYPYSLNSTLNSLDEFYYSRGTLANAWMLACDLADAVNAGGADAQLEPDLDLAQAAQVLAEELDEEFASTRPDGTEWTTVLDEFDVTTWDEGYSLGRRLGYTDDEDYTGYYDIYNQMADMLTADDSTLYTDDGDPYASIGVGLYYGTDYVYLDIILVTWQ